MGLLDIFTKGRGEQTQRSTLKTRKRYYDYIDLSEYGKITNSTSSNRVIYIIKSPQEDEEEIRKYLKLVSEGNVVILYLPLTREEKFKEKLREIIKREAPYVRGVFVSKSHYLEQRYGILYDEREYSVLSLEESKKRP